MGKIMLMDQNNKDLVYKWISSLSILPSSKKVYSNQIELYYQRHQILNPQNIKSFLTEGTGDKRSYARKYAVKSFLQFLAKQNMIALEDYTDALGVKYRIKDRKSEQTTMLDELELLIDGIIDDKLRLILMLLFDTGSRIRAVLRLRNKDIRIVGGETQLFLSEKGEKTQKKIITQQTYTHLQQYLTTHKYKYVFLDKDKANTQDLDEEYYKQWSLLKNESRRILGSSISFHWVRRGAGLYVYNKLGKDIVATQEFFGHTTPTVTSRYLKISGERVKDLMRKEERTW